MGALNRYFSLFFAIGFINMSYLNIFFVCKGQLMNILGFTLSGNKNKIIIWNFLTLKF